MSDYSELKILAESILNMDHKADGNAWTKAWEKFEEAATPEEILRLISENERLEYALKLRKDNLTMLRGDVESKDRRIRNHFETIDSLADERDQLKAENEALRKIATELRRWASCEHVHHDKSDQHEFDEPCKVLERIDAAMDKGDQS